MLFLNQDNIEARSVRRFFQPVAGWAMVYALGGCISTPSLTKWPWQSNEVPLTEFAAQDGNYFPPFVTRFFPAIDQFSADYPSVGQARSDLRLIAVKRLNAEVSTGNEANLSWSADGAYLGFEVVSEGFRRIMLKDLVGNYSKELQVLPKGSGDFLKGMVPRGTQSYNAGLRWSRDSTRFAFMSNGGTGEYNIYVGAVGRDEQIIARSPTKDGYAAWSPATSEIAFVSSRSGNGDIYIVTVPGGTVERLSFGPAIDIFPEWLPNGQGIVYSSGNALNHDLHIVKRQKSKGEFGTPTKITEWRNDDLRPTVSPDGRYIAFYSNSIESRLHRPNGGEDSSSASNASQRWNIIVVPTSFDRPYSASELSNMVVARDVVIDLNTGPAWSPDSQKLFYVCRDPATFNPICGYDLFSGRRYKFRTNTKMNRDILMSKAGILSFRAQVGAWDRVFLALTNQGAQLQAGQPLTSKIHYLAL